MEDLDLDKIKELAMLAGLPTDIEFTAAKFVHINASGEAQYEVRYGNEINHVYVKEDTIPGTYKMSINSLL